MSRPVLRRDEVVLRAIQETHIDEKEGRVSSSLFKGRDISLSRLAVLPIDEILSILRRDLDKPTNSLVGAAEVTVAVIEDAGGRDDKGQVVVRVVADPLPEPAPNPAHAEIPQNLSRGVSKAIIKGISRYVRPDGNVLEFPVRRWSAVAAVVVEPPVLVAPLPSAELTAAHPPPEAERGLSKRVLYVLAIVVGLALLLLWLT